MAKGERDINPAIGISLRNTARILYQELKASYPQTHTAKWERVPYTPPTNEEIEQQKKSRWEKEQRLQGAARGNSRYDSAPPARGYERFRWRTAHIRAR